MFGFLFNKYRQEGYREGFAAGMEAQREQTEKQTEALYKELMESKSLYDEKSLEYEDFLNFVSRIYSLDSDDIDQKWHIRRNDESLYAFIWFLSSHMPLFITGKAGTGKTTLLRRFRDYMIKIGKNAVVVAPTGVAALTANGQTIHSFFGFRPDITEEKAKKRNLRYIENIAKNLDVLIIDEISMVRADLLDCVHTVLSRARKNKKPFGGVRVLFFGDLAQLEPVTTENDIDIFTGDDAPYRSPFFFDAKVLSGTPLFLMELNHVYRQKNPHFIAALNDLRGGSDITHALMYFNDRYTDMTDVPHPHIYLTARRDQAQQYNMDKLAQIQDEPRVFEGVITGEFPDNILPTQKKLVLKKGAQIMLLNNDPEGRWVNGTLATIVGFEDAKDPENDTVYTAVLIRTEDMDEDDEPHTIGSMAWDNTRFVYNKEKKRIESEVIGRFVQYPIALGWAFTIHKMQGKTISTAIVDFGARAFSHGHVYVALSRTRDIDGLFLKRPLKEDDIITDARVGDFLSEFKDILTSDEHKLTLRIKKHPQR